MYCMNCKFWDVDHARGIDGKIFGDVAAECLWEFPAPIPVSAQIFSAKMRALDGRDCACFSEQRAPAPVDDSLDLDSLGAC